MKLLIEVGAFDGSDSLRYHDRGYTVYTFEPKKDLFQQLVDKTQHLENYTVIPKAVSLKNGKTQFNICKSGGASSILQFRPDHELLQTWSANRTDVHFSGESYDVDTTRLDTFIEENGLENQCIDFIHIDAQGVDLDVLKSLGKYMVNVQEGVLETVVDVHKSIYVGQDENTLEHVAIFLSSNGFEITQITGNDHTQCEYNVYFKKTPVVATPPLRVAVLFVGRAGCYEDSYHWFRELAERYDVHFYCSLNSDIEPYEKFIKMYNVKKYNFETYRPPDDTFDELSYNRLSMFYNLKKGIEMIPAEEYDVILYARTDFLYDAKLELAVSGDTDIHIPNCYDWCDPGLNDTMCYGSPRAMKLYASLYDNIHTYHPVLSNFRNPDRYDCALGNHVHPETYLKYHVDYVGLTVHRFEFEYIHHPERYVKI
jgi:FkbM family methyltransferase